MSRLFQLGIVIAVSCLSSCAGHDLPINAKPNTSSSGGDDANIVIKSVQFYGWTGEGKNKKYVRLEKWQEISKKQVSDPVSFDVVCHVEYTGDTAAQHGDYFGLTSLSFLVAPDNEPPADLSHIDSTIGTVSDVKMEHVSYVKSRESAQITFKDFNLTEIIKLFNEEDQLTWPWAVKANVYILNRDMAVVTKGQSVLRLVPANEKAPAK